MILEGCYPYVRGGVSSWMHEYIQGMPEHEFVLWVIGAKAEDEGKFKYELPRNVAEIHEVFLDDALRLRPTGKEKLRFTPEQVTALRQLLACEAPDWEVLFDTYNVKKTGVLSFRVPGTPSEVLADLLSDEGVCTRAGLHCAPLAHRTAGTEDTGTVRLSLSFYSTARQLEQAADKVCRVVKKL